MARVNKMAVFDKRKVFRHQAITPSDSTELSNQIIAILVQVSGDVSMTDRFGTTITYAGVPAYTTFENFAPLRINATGTTATGIVAWFEES